jgi:hypothetical protein
MRDREGEIWFQFGRARLSLHWSEVTFVTFPLVPAEHTPSFTINNVSPFLIFKSPTFFSFLHPLSTPSSINVWFILKSLCFHVTICTPSSGGSTNDYFSQLILVQSGQCIHNRNIHQQLCLLIPSTLRSCNASSNRTSVTTVPAWHSEWRKSRGWLCLLQHPNQLCSSKCTVHNLQNSALIILFSCRGKFLLLPRI